jgi:hypothetical protein
MTASTIDRNSPMLGQGGRISRLPLATDANVPAGVLVGVTSAGAATNAANTAGMRVAGRSTARANEAAGDTHVQAQAGVYAFVAAAALAAAGAAALYKEVYVVDNQTVGLATEAGGITSNRVLAGVLVQISDGKHYVAVGLGLEAAAAITGEDAAPLANAAVSPAVTVPGVPVEIPFLIPDAATADYDYITQEAIEIVDVRVIKDAAGAGNTITIKNGAGTAISDAIAAAVDKAVTRAGTLDKATRVLAAGAVIRITATRAAGSMAAAVFIHAIKR